MGADPRIAEAELFDLHLVDEAWAQLERRGPALDQGVWNPYLAELDGWAMDTVMGGYVWWKGGIRHVDLHDRSRWDLTTRYSFAIPSEEALQLVARYGPLVELGAGTGYWARCLQERGVDVVPLDVMGRIRETWFPSDVAPWTTITEGTEEDLIYYGARTLFLCWPPRTEGMASRALRCYPGTTLVYVGDDGEVTASRRFIRTLEREWEQIDGCAIPQWQSLHDHLSVWRRGPITA